jgi:hypothetical protein
MRRPIPSRPATAFLPFSELPPLAFPRIGERAGQTTVIAVEEFFYGDIPNPKLAPPTFTP